MFCFDLTWTFSPQIKDEAFDEAEKKFRLQERLIKSFIRDISLYLQHIRVRTFYHHGMKNQTLRVDIILTHHMFKDFQNLNVYI